MNSLMPDPGFALTPDAVGREVGSGEVEVSFRMTAAYAAAIGAEHERYLDDGVAGGAVAPPAFAVVLEWPLLLRQPYIGLLGAPEDRYFERLLHAFQDTRLHRLVRPGDRLRLRAVLVQLRPTAAGALAVCRVETTCARTGAPVTTSWIGSLFRGCPVRGEGVSTETVPTLGAALPADEGQAEPIAIPRSLPFVYTECSGHWNPIHTERAFARAAGYADLVVHGTATWALACQRLIERHAGGDPHRLKRYGSRFAGVLTPGQTVVLRHAPLPQRPGLVSFGVAGQGGAAVLSHGLAQFDG